MSWQEKPWKYNCHRLDGNFSGPPLAHVSRSPTWATAAFLRVDFVLSMSSAESHRVSPTALLNKGCYYPISQGGMWRFRAIAKVNCCQLGARATFALWPLKAEPEFPLQSCVTSFLILSISREKKLCAWIFFLTRYSKCAEQEEIIWRQTKNSETALFREAQ